MEVYTTEPGMQLYTANHLNGDSKNGGFKQYGAFCLETQHFPDSPNHPEFPTTLLKPGQTYKQTTVYKFLVK
jgi:aldose 1-epimerase